MNDNKAPRRKRSDDVGRVQKFARRAVGIRMRKWSNVIGRILVPDARRRRLVKIRRKRETVISERQTNSMGPRDPA